MTQPSQNSGTIDGMLGLRVLCVDDYSDIRELLSQVLTDAGYAVSVAASAEEGLERLVSEQFHLVITDYELPGENGAWMLNQAKGQGLLAHTVAVILTGAYRVIDDAGEFPIIRKPVDVDRFLATIYEMLSGIRDEEIRKTRQRLESTLNSGARAPSVRLELTLYVSAASASSLKAFRNLETLLQDYDASQVQLTVVDLAKERSQMAEEDRIVFTPTLVKRFPEPRAYLIGTLEQIDAVRDLLADASVEMKH
jgi:CheY-like chemotaxis protein